MAALIAEALAGQGWPEPVFADSGNGAHLLYRLDLPNNAETTDLLKRCLKALSARYSTDDVAVDETTFNASRIFKAYGTTSRKGDDTAERPHRSSRILEAPGDPAVVPHELLEGLAGEVPADTASQARVYTMPPRPGASRFDLDGFLTKHGIRFRAAQSYQGGRKLILEECPWDPTHRAPDAAVFEAADGRLGFRCLHNSCRNLSWRDFASFSNRTTAKPTGNGFLRRARGIVRATPAVSTALQLQFHGPRRSERRATMVSPANSSAWSNRTLRLIPLVAHPVPDLCRERHRTECVCLGGRRQAPHQSVRRGRRPNLSRTQRERTGSGGNVLPWCGRDLA